MICVNQELINFSKFPDGTASFRYSIGDVCCFHIEWKYDGDHECIQLWHLVHHIRNTMGRDAYIQLFMPYVPNARMDRVKNRDEVFTLKWFADFINALAFDEVTVLDPHSNVATALINNIKVVRPDGYIKKVIATIADDNLLLCYPDEGAAKRYSDSIGIEYVFGIKHRDWRTGKIERLELINGDKTSGRNVLIVDDICSRGGTFTHTAKALKACGANEIYLYVSHCENTVFSGSVLTDGLISHVFTTDSIYRGDNEKITVIG